MKILFVLPASLGLRVTPLNREVPHRKMLHFSLLPLITVAGLTPPEHEVTICDEHVEPLDFDCGADLVAVSFMTSSAPRAYEIAAEFRKRGKTVVAGGYHMTFLPDEASQHFDAVVVGDAAVLWRQVLKDVSEGSLKKIYRHTIPPSLDRSPPSHRDLLKGDGL